MIYDPHDYQIRAISWIMTRPKCALWLEMGLGKSVITLTAVRKLQDALEIGRVLVIAPLSVARNTWSDECMKWDHLKDMRVSLALGSAGQRSAALSAPSDLCVINRENTEWFCGWAEEFPEQARKYDMIVIDESTSFKSHSSKRFKALRKFARTIPRMVLLTGTPSPNGYEDLWGQFCLLDDGQRLGRTWTGFLGTYFRPLFGNGRITYKYALLPSADEEIRRRISDITLTMRAQDYLQVPDCMVIDRTVTLTDVERAAYDTLKRDYIAEIEGQELTAQTAVALSTKLHQISGGAVYTTEHDDAEPMVLQTGSSKMSALCELVESAQAGGESVLVYYQYRHELPRLQEALKEYRPVFFNGQSDVLRKWNEGKIRVLLAHPASVSYGLNMQQGGHIIVWYSLTYNLEQYQQANARLHRQGQSAPVRIYRMIADRTIDGTIAAALSGKRDVQDELMAYLKEMCFDEM